MNIADRIGALNDIDATRILAIAARPHMRATSVETSLSPELAAALGQASGDAPQGAAPSDGDIARAALLVLADDPSTAPAITALLDGPTPELRSRPHGGRRCHNARPARPPNPFPI